MTDNSDSRIVLIPPGPPKRTVKDQINIVSLDLIKTAFIVEGQDLHQLSKRFHMPLNMMRKLIAEERFEELRRLHIRHGIQHLQNNQILQAQEVLDLETQFKNIKIVQLKAKLKDHLAYLEKHGDFYKRNAKGVIALDTNGIPVQIRLPDAAKDLKQIKESVILAEGIKRILTQIDKLLRGEDARDDGLSIEDFFEE